MKLSIIKTLLTGKGMSMTALAEKSGMSRRGFYSAIENNTITAEVLEKVAKILDVSITIFFEDDTEIEENRLHKEIIKLAIENENLEKEVKNLSEREEYLLAIIRTRRSLFKLIYSQLKMHNDLDIQISAKQISDIIQVIDESEKFEEAEQILKDRQAERKQRNLEGKSNYELQKEINEKMKKRSETDIPTHEDTNNTK